MDRRRRTALLPGAAATGFRAGDRWALRADLLGAVRGRLRLIAALLLFAFVFDPFVHACLWLSRTLLGRPLPPDFAGLVRLDPVGLGAAAASLGVWWAARRERISPAALVTTTLVYEVGVCFVVALLSFRHFYIETGVLPRITWVIGIIILFPLVVPAPPRQILLAAVASALASAPALRLLVVSGLITESPGYLAVVINPLLAAVFAYCGARVVHGLGRQAAALRELGSYRLEARLGRGGMGEVWRARHRLLARPAAIKLIRPNPAAAGNPKALQDMVRRFRCEAEVIAGLRSPHTVTLFDFGVSTDGDLYYVMELLEGLDADALVRRFGPQPPDRVVRLLCQVCHSLSEAESRGVVHRDIKPANIFLCRYGEDRDFVKVLDFGLAKVLDNAPAGTPDDDDDDGNIREEPVCGTPAYMAPEQAKGDTALDIRADIYALGCVAYWLLTGSTVFSAGNAAGQLIAQRTEAPVPPSQRTRTPIPPDLERLVMDCLEKDPEQRPQTVGELRTRLDPCDTGTWTEENARDWWGRVPTEPAPAATAGVPQPDGTTRTVLPDLPTA